MKFRFYGCSSDLPPVEAVGKLCRLSRITAERMAERLKTFEKFSFDELRKTQDIKKIQGRNPNKVHELKVGIPEGGFRLFFIMIVNGIAYVVHIAHKKSPKIQKDIELAMKRAREVT